MMTTKMTSRDASVELNRIAAELHAAMEDVALAERLKTALDRVKRLTAEQQKVTDIRNRAILAEIKADEESRLAGISDVSVTCSPNSEHESVLRSSFTLHYTRPAWDMYSQRSLPRAHSVGLTAAPSEVIEYLITRCPERIPQKILDLAPDNPAEAFRQYRLGLRRGYIQR